MAEKARKKSKKVRNLIIGLVVLLLLAAALVVLLLTTSAPEEEAESSAYESTLVDLVVSEADDINELTVENAEGGFDIIRVSEATEDEDAVYGIEELESFLTDESELSSIIDQFANVSAMRLIEENAPDIAKYGLDDPTYVVTTYYDDGTTHTFTVGDILPTDNGAYMMIDDDPNVYSMGDTKMSRLDYTALDFMDLNVIDEWESYTDDDGNEVTAPTIEYLQVTGGTLEDVFRMEPIDTEEETSLASSYGSTYRIVSPIESDFRVKTNAEGGDDNAVYTTGLQSLTALSVEAINPTEEDMAAYGLDEPYCTIEFSRDGTEHTWLVGDALTTEDGTAAHYFYSEDQPVIYVVADSSLPWISMNLDELYTPQQLLPYIDDVGQIDLMVYGETYTFEIDAADPDDEDSDIVPHLDGEEVDLEYYRTMYQYLLLAPAEGIYEGDPDAGELVASFTYHYRDGGSDTVELYDLGNRTCILSINGNYQWTTRIAYVTYLQTNIEKLQNGEEPSLDY